MSLLKPVNILLTVVFLLYSFDFAYNAPLRNLPHICGTGEPLPQRNNAEIFDDALDINGRVMIQRILNTEMKDDELLFYEYLERMAEAALSMELESDYSREAQALREVLVGVAKDACTWVTDTVEPDEPLNGTETEGSESGIPDSVMNGVNCSNTTDILRFARAKEIDFINERFPDTNISVDTLSLALRLRPVAIDMRIYLRSVIGNNIVPGSREDKQAWVTRNISPCNLCYVCRTIST